MSFCILFDGASFTTTTAAGAAAIAAIVIVVVPKIRFSFDCFSNNPTFATTLKLHFVSINH